MVAYNGSAELPEGLRPIVMDHSGKWFAVRPHHQTHGPLFVPKAMKGAMSEGIVMESVQDPPDDIGQPLTRTRQTWDRMQPTENP